MKKTILTLGSVLGLTFMAHGQATTAAVGYNTVTCLPNSDTIVSVPFLNTTDSISTTVSGTASETGSAPDNIATFTMANVSGLTNDQYADNYYVRFTSGQLEGNFYQITGNTATTVSIAMLGDSSVQIEDGNKFSIYKFWTLGTLFPQATQTTIVESTGNLLFQRKTEILIPNVSGTGINLPAGSKHFLTSSGWVNADGFGSSDDVNLWPDTYFIVRHTSSVTESTTYRPSGTVDANAKFVIPLSTRTEGKQDNYIAIPRPVNVKLSDLGLVSSNAFVTSSGNLTFQRRDELILFDNTATGKNKSSSKKFFHNGANWVDADGFTNADDYEITPSQGMMIRKYQTNDGATAFWTNTPNY